MPNASSATLTEEVRMSLEFFTQRIAVLASSSDAAIEQSQPRTETDTPACASPGLYVERRQV